MLSHHFVQLGAHRASASGDIMHLICYPISHDHLFQWSCDSIGGSPSRKVTTLPYLVSIGGIVVVEICF